MRIKFATILLIAVLSVVLISGCIGNDNNDSKKYIVKDNVKYTFYKPLDEVKDVEIQDKQKILSLLYNTEKITFVSNESSPDSGKYAVAVIGIKEKLQNYFAQSGKLVKFNAADMNNENLSYVDNPIVLIQGPNEGAEENLVKHVRNNVILIKGKDYDGLKLVSDGLSYLVITARVVEQ